MGDGTKENPFTREDVLRLIKENGDTAAGLDLSGKVFEKRINLRKLDLREINLNEAELIRARLERANLRYARLERANLRYAHLEKAILTRAHLEEAILTRAHLEKAHLWNAHLEKTDLFAAHLEEAHLDFTRLSPDTYLIGVHWGNYILGDEKEYGHGEDSYRRLKQWYTNAGMYDIAAEFYYREMEAKRKFAQGQIREQFEKSKGWKFLCFLFKKKDFGNWIRLWIYRLACGYGEKPWRVVLWGMLVLFGLALLYFFLRGVAPHTLTAEAFLASLYYSAVSFTALGYGPWFSASSVRGWAQGVGAAEAIIGVFSIALFLITFVRKMTR